MKLYYAPNACSLAIHVLLEEIGKPYELQRVDFSKREQYGPEFIAINPKSKVPVLERDGGSHLTELPAIAWYLARANPQANLLPADIEGEARGVGAHGLSDRHRAYAGFHPDLPAGEFFTRGAGQGKSSAGRQGMSSSRGSASLPHAWPTSNICWAAFPLPTWCCFFWNSGRCGATA